MKEIELKSISAGQLFKVLAIIISTCVLAGGLILSLYGLVTGGMEKFLGALLGALVFATVMPLMYGAVAAITALLYNFVAKLVGGFKITLDIEDK